MKDACVYDSLFYTKKKKPLAMKAMLGYIFPSVALHAIPNS